MKKWSLLLVVVFLLMLAGCQGNSVKKGETSATPETSATESMDMEQSPSATKPKPQIEMDQEELAKVVAKNLGVPDGLKFTYEIGDLFYWDAGEIWLRHVAIHAEDGGGATAAVDPTTGELIRSILNYEKPE